MENEKGLWPLKMCPKGRVTRKERNRINDFAVKALLSKLREERGHEYQDRGEPDAVIRNRPAPDRELAKATTGTLIGVELVDDFSGDEYQGMSALMPDLFRNGSLVVQVEDPRVSLLRVIANKHEKGQLRDYEPGCRILLVGLARHGAAVLGVDKVGVQGLSESMTYMDEFPDIDHVFVWWLESPVGVHLEHLWSRSSLP